MKISSNEKKAKVFDVFLFYNEIELLELRLNTLDSLVDYFVITEARVTFSGKPKELFFEINKEKFKKFKDKIIHNIIDITPNTFEGIESNNDYFTKRDKSYPHKSGGIPLEKLSIDFQREVFQRDSIINGLLNAANSNDIIIISDLDEIPNPVAVKKVIDSFEEGIIYNLCQKWYMYYFNVACNNEWFGTRITNFAMLKGSSVDLMRFHLENREDQPGPIVEDGGWHFSFLGGQERVREKLNAYSYQGRRSKAILKLLDKIFPWRIKKKIDRNTDIFNTGRQFRVVEIDENFPQFLIENQENFKSLIKL